MCLYPTIMKNKRYAPKAKFSGTTRVPIDPRLYYIETKCGKCIECRKEKARNWSIRMQEELKVNPKAYFVGMSLSDESIKELIKKYKLKDDQNEVAKKALRLWLERCRKDTGKSIRHWCITELGHKNTERIHLHGILWGEDSAELLKKHWKYGIVFIGQWVNNQSINYMVKYMIKPDLDHPEFQGKVLCSSGIGAKYVDGYNAVWMNRYKGEDTVETYRTQNGAKIGLPDYYRKKIYTDEEREQLTIIKMNKNEKWIGGSKVKADDYEQVLRLRDAKQKEAINMMRYDPWNEIVGNRLRWNYDESTQRERYNKMFTMKEDKYKEWKIWEDEIREKCPF